MALGRDVANGHVRRYGADYLERLASVGFRVERFDVDELMDPATRVRHGIKSDCLVICFKE